MVLGLTFPYKREDWRLDVVSLLAVIGESSMSKHAQPLTASKLCLLPRLMPAPQALIRSSRPSSLPSEHAHVAGVRSGNYLQELNYFANLIHPIDGLAPHSVQHIRIKHKAQSPKVVKKDVAKKGAAKKDDEPPEDTIKEIRPKFSALSALTILSSFIALGLLVWAGMVHDAPAFIAILIISITSSLVGFASWWEPSLTQRAYRCDVPPGDIVIRTRNGAFIVVECSEDIARELYIGSEDCKYKLHSRVAQSFVGLGTVLLMFGVILVGNSSFELQLGLGAAYITLNAFYWAAALLPARYNWDLSARYEHEEVDKPMTYGSYTQALYGAMILGHSGDEANKNVPIETQWCRTSGAMPDTEVWREWLREVSDTWQYSVDDAQKCWTDINNRNKLANGTATRLQKDPESPAYLVRQGTMDLDGQAPAMFNRT